MRVKIIMMQKNESELLRPWLAYHGDLVGFENLYIFDNGSTEASTLQALACGERLGATVNRSANTREAFVNKGQIITDTIHAFEFENAADFYVPLDADEFLVVRTDTGVSSDREAIETELARYVGKTSPLMIAAGLDNNPVMPGHFCWSPSQRKTFFADGACGLLDRGFHVGSSKDGSDPIKTNVVYVHYHYKPYRALIEHSKEKLRAFTDDFSAEAVRSYIEEQRDGWHCAVHLLTSEEEYYRCFHAPNYQPQPEIVAMFERSG